MTTETDSIAAPPPQLYVVVVILLIFAGVLIVMNSVLANHAGDLNDRIRRQAVLIQRQDFEVRRAEAALKNVGGIIENLENSLSACLVDKLPPPGAWPPARINW